MNEKMHSDAPHTVLVVDDEPTLRMGFEMALQTEGYRTETASDGEEALARLQDETLPNIDVVLLDLRMPGKDGMSVIRELKTLDLVYPIILCSAFIDSTTAVEAVGNRVVDFLRKPMKPDQIRTAISDVLDSERLSDTELSDSTMRVKRLLRRGLFSDASQLIEANPDGKELLIWKFLIDHLTAIHPVDSEVEEGAHSRFHHASDVLDILTR